MGQTLSEPVTLKNSASCENDKYKVGSSSMQGWRVSMEDAHVHLLTVEEDKEATFFAVYDGHGGSAVSKYAGNNLHKYIVKRQAYRDGNVANAVREGFLEFDMAMQRDERMKNDVSGSTAVTVLIKGDKLYCGNAGDSRAVACINGKCHPLSSDHKPSNPIEQARIKEAGGWVEFNRVNGNLALSRAVGDFAFKRNAQKTPEEQMVTALPDVEIRTITEDWEFIIMACDGIWDVVTNEEAVEFVRYPLGAGMEPDKICEELMTACLAPDCQMGGLGCDNMTVILICFLHGQSWRKYCSRISKDLEPSLLGYTTKLPNFAVLESSDDDEDAIPNERISESKSIGASLNLSYTPSRKLEFPDGEQEAAMDSQVFQEVIEAGDFIHKGKGVVLNEVTTAAKSEIPTNKSPTPLTMNELVSVLDEDVLRLQTTPQRPQEADRELKKSPSSIKKTQ